jgi:RHS repeat-associated protein
MRTAMKRWLGIWAAASGLVATAAAADTITYYHNDLAGSPVVATNESGQVIWRESYRPYGERTVNSAAALDNKVWFTSRRQDPETGLVYMGARYYDPVVGRFVSTDPAGFDEKNLHSFNRYAYANNNPYKYVDPDGRDPVRILGLAAYPLGVAADAISQYAAFGSVDVGLAATSSAAEAGAWITSLTLAGMGVAAAADSAATAAANEARVIANGIRGRASEAQVLSELGLAKNTTSVSTAEGRSIPDALNRALSVEVKDAASVSLTKQLRIQTEAARASGRESVLITGEKTCVSGPCSRAFDTTIRRPDLGPQ